MNPGKAAVAARRAGALGTHPQWAFNVWPSTRWHVPPRPLPPRPVPYSLEHRPKLLEARGASCQAAEMSFGARECSKVHTG